MSAIRDLLRRAEALQTVSESPRLDAELLLCHCLKVPRSHLYAHPEQEVESEAQHCFDRLFARRSAGEPVAYLRGRKAFWTLDLCADSRALIPRPETELLVETALRLLPEPPQRVADIGTGSGAVSLALAAERPNWRILAADRSPQALALAEQNRRRLGLPNVRMVCADWCAGLRPRSFSMIVCNPPYMDADDPALDRPPLCHEPRLALVGGLQTLDTLAHQALHCLQAGGLLLLEHAPHQASQVRRSLRTRGYLEVRTFEDLSALPRLSAGRTP